MHVDGKQDSKLEDRVRVFWEMYDSGMVLALAYGCLQYGCKKSHVTGRRTQCSSK